jgi:hypothetical protein
MGDGENLNDICGVFSVDEQVREAPKQKPPRTIGAVGPPLRSLADLGQRFFDGFVKSKGCVRATL